MYEGWRIRRRSGKEKKKIGGKIKIDQHLFFAHPLLLNLYGLTDQFNLPKNICIFLKDLGKIQHVKYQLQVIDNRIHFLRENLTDFLKMEKNKGTKGEVLD